jgi:hypothetical protein
MVVMESNICGMAVGTSSRTQPNLAAAEHNNQHQLSSAPPPPASNRWYDHMAQSAAAFQQFGGSNNGLSSEADIADAYFKCNNIPAAASTYFSQMQGAYGGMPSHTPQHGKKPLLQISFL